MTPARIATRVLPLAMLAALIACMGLAGSQAAEPAKADIMLRGGKIYTANKERSIKQAIAVTGNGITAVGSDDDIALLIGPATKVIDLGGKLVLSGLIDTHIHPVLGAVSRAKCSLAGVKAIIDALKPVVEACLDKDLRGDEEWFEAVQLDNYGFSATAKDLDTIEANRPLALEGGDGHTMWVNSRRLELLGVTAATPDPRGGKIFRDAEGAPTGSFSDSAAILVTEKLPAPPVEEQVALTAAELEDMHAYGITSLMDAFVTPAEAAVWRRLYDTGQLPMRVRMAIYVANPSDDSGEAVARLLAATKAGDVDPDFLRSDMVKVFADGVSEYPAQTAAMPSPYLGADGKPSDHKGELYFEPERFASLVTKLDAAGVTVHVHAIGDRAVRASLDGFAAARAANGDRDNRHQIAHLQLVDPADFSRFKELGVSADFQLEWAKREPATEGPLEPCLGPERYRYVYPAGSLHRAGATIIGGSDWDISSYNPFLAFQTAVTRTGGKGQKSLNIEESIPLTTAIDAYTINAAYALKQDKTTGSLEAGKRADLIVLDRDILTVDPETMAATKVLATYLDGHLVYAAPPGGAGGHDDTEAAGWWTSARRVSAPGCIAIRAGSTAACAPA
jgi:predicted amidohydrolase YtcJ